MKRLITITYDYRLFFPLLFDIVSKYCFVVTIFSSNTEGFQLHLSFICSCTSSLQNNNTILFQIVQVEIIDVSL